MDPEVSNLRAGRDVWFLALDHVFVESFAGIDDDWSSVKGRGYATILSRAAAMASLVAPISSIFEGPQNPTPKLIWRNLRAFRSEADPLRV